MTHLISPRPTSSQMTSFHLNRESAVTDHDEYPGHALWSDPVRRGCDQSVEWNEVGRDEAGWDEIRWWVMRTLRRKIAAVSSVDARRATELVNAWLGRTRRRHVHVASHRFLCAGVVKDADDARHITPEMVYNSVRRRPPLCRPSVV